MAESDSERGSNPISFIPNKPGMELIPTHFHLGRRFQQKFIYCPNEDVVLLICLFKKWVLYLKTVLYGHSWIVKPPALVGAGLPNISFLLWPWRVAVNQVIAHLRSLFL